MGHHQAGQGHPRRDPRAGLTDTTPQSGRRNASAFIDAGFGLAKGFPTRAVELWFAFGAGDDAGPPPQDMRLKAYGFIGAAQQIGIAWLDGHLPLTIDEVVEQLVDLFYRISGIAPPSPHD
jgi:hypothetical protein